MFIGADVRCWGGLGFAIRAAVRCYTAVECRNLTGYGITLQLIALKLAGAWEVFLSTGFQHFQPRNQRRAFGF